MKYHQILVPYDGSDHAKAAFTAARTLALPSDDAEIYVLNVVPMALATTMPVAPDPITGGASSFIDQEGYTTMIDAALDNIKQEINDVVKELLDGMPAERVHIDVATYPSAVSGITEYASNHDCDLIVMGRRGVGGIRGVLGSVSYGVLRSVDIPVLTVK